MTEEMLRLNRSIYTTLNEIFPAVSVIPDDYTILLASDDPALPALDAAEISRRRKRPLAYPVALALLSGGSGVAGELPFSVLNFAGGILIASQFPLACRIYLRRAGV